jgi:competence protein ComEC
MRRISDSAILFVSDVLFACAIAVLSGVAMVSFLEFGRNSAFVFLLLGVACWGAFWGRRNAIVAGVFFVVLSGSVAYANERMDRNSLLELVGKSFEGTVCVIGASKQEAHTQRIPVISQSCADEPCVERKALLRTNPWETYRVGDVLVISCEWEVPERDEKTGVDWFGIFASRGPVLFCRDDNPLFTGKREINWRSVFAGTRQNLEGRIDRLLPHPESSLGAGLLFGGTGHMSNEWEEKFSETSMTHIVAVSGYNVTLLVSYFGILAVALGMRRQRSWFLGVAAVVGFVALIGFPSSGVRAGVMGVLALIAISGGATNASLRALVIASAVMVFAHPFLLRYDVGFQLSVLATLGIILGSPIASRWGVDRLSPIVKLFADIAITTLFAQIFVIPIILSTFGSFSLFSFAANLLILWNIPFAMALVMLVLIASVFGSAVGAIAATPATILLGYNLFVIEKLSEIKGMSISGDVLPTMGVVIYYGILAMVFLWYYGSDFWKRRARCARYDESYATRTNSV